VTVPVARTLVRRNVRMVVALVIGQAVLCVVIGYVALGGAGPRHATMPHAVGPLAAPTVAAPPPDRVPSVGSRTPAPPGASPPGQPIPSVPASGEPVLPATTPAPPGSAEPVPQLLDSVQPDGTTTAGPSPTATPGGTATQPVTPTSDQVATPQSSRIEQDVVLGDPCDTANAKGVTSDGVEVVCLPDTQGDLVWQLPKQPPGQIG
jgi:hypothetical protein